MTDSFTIRDDAYSFTTSAHTQQLVTEVIERTHRVPFVDDESPYFGFEREAQRTLGLADNQKFIVIVRARLLEGRPGALQRVYLNPAAFPKDFLDRHDFGAESLIAIYKQYGYCLVKRDTVLAARLSNNYDKITLKHLQQALDSQAVLDSEQKLYATRAEGGEAFVLEFLKAAYFDHWKFEIKNRPA